MEAPVPVAPGDVKNPEGWGNIKDVIDGPLVDVPPDASWLSVVGMWLWLLPNLIQGVIGGLVPRVFVCLTIGTCCIPCSKQLCSVYGAVLNGRPLMMAWTMWRAMVAALVALVANSKSRLALFLWEQKAFGGGRFWWHGEGVWVGSYEDCDRILQGDQHRRAAFGCVNAATPDLFPTKLLIFLPNAGGDDSEWKRIRSGFHQMFLDQGAETYQKRMQQLPNKIKADWATPKMADLNDKSLLQRCVSKCVMWMLFEIWVTDEEATTLTHWRTYAGDFVLPRLVHRFLFNKLISKVKILREQTVKIVEKYGKQDVFVRLNDSLGDAWKRSPVVQLCDEIMFGVCFAGIGGTCAAVESVSSFLQVKIPKESAGPEHIKWGQYDTQDKMIAKYKENPERYIRETCRMDPPVTSATSSFNEETTVELAGQQIALPKGVLNQYALSVANRDKALFPEESVFNPDRENLNKALTWNGAFGAENEADYPRICPGRYLALQFVQMVIDHALSGDA